MIDGGKSCVQAFSAEVRFRFAPSGPFWLLAGPLLGLEEREERRVETSSADAVARDARRGCSLSFSYKARSRLFVYWEETLQGKQRWNNLDLSLLMRL